MPIGGRVPPAPRERGKMGLSLLLVRAPLP